MIYNIGERRFLSYADAVEHLLNMVERRDRKITALQKRIAKLEARIESVKDIEAQGQSYRTARGVLLLDTFVAGDVMVALDLWDEDWLEVKLNALKQEKDDETD